MLAVHVVCADTQDEARRLLAPFAENLVKLKSGKLNPFTLLATPEKAIAQLGMFINLLSFSFVLLTFFNPTYNRRITRS